MTKQAKSHSQRLLGNAFWNGFPSLFRIAVGILLVPYILSQVGNELYGIWRISFSILYISWILQIGLNSSVNREVPQGLVRRDYNRISEVISTVIVFYSIISIIILVAVITLVVKFPVWVHVPIEHYTVSRIVIGITGIGFIIWMPFSVFRSVMNGLQSFTSIGIVEVLMTICYTLAAFLLLGLDYGIIALTCLGVARLVLPVVILTFLAKYFCPQITISFRNASLKTFRSIFAYSANSAIYTIATAFFAQGGIWVTGFLLGPAKTTYYSTCYQLAALIGGFLAIGLVVIKPAASQFQALGDMERVRILFLRSIKYVLMVSLPAAFFLCIFRNEILMAWLGREDFIRVSYLIPILAITQVTWLSLQTSYFVINGIGHHRVFAIIAVVTTLTSIISAILFFKIGNMDLLGVAIGMSLPVVFVSLIIIPVYSCKVLSLSIFKYIRMCLLRLIVPLLTFILFLISWKRIVANMSLIQLLLCMFTSVVVIGISYWNITLSENERLIFKGIASNLIERVISSKQEI
ncbi:lipopolysaccharide biosynthesis protein [Planctomycetota bacterium]